MIVGIMQPYFFPYIGYFQLIKACDVFVLHDEVQYIKGGWINRNRILKDGKTGWITFPVLRAVHERAINERYYKSDAGTRNRLLRRIEAVYRVAPRFSKIYPLIEEIMSFSDSNVAAFNVQLIDQVAAHLNIRTPLLLSSNLSKNNSLAGQDRVVDICRRLGATRYINLIGGRNLYSPDRFSCEGIDLSFLEPAVLGLTRSGAGSSTPLSIIDDLMNTDGASLPQLLKEYRVIGPSHD